MNTAEGGYHHTLTLFMLAQIRAFADARPSDELVRDIVAALLQSEIAVRDYPLRFYRAETLFSPAARLGWVPPDLP
jgi:hypothetical protein